MGVVFRITETMQGTHHFVDPSLGDPIDRPCYFRIQWAGRPSSLNPRRRDFLHYRTWGVILVDGLMQDEEPCLGSLVIDYVKAHKITYDLEFQVQGKTHRYHGEKRDIQLTRPLQLIKTHTTCYGHITDPRGRTISKSVLHFELESLASFLTSFRLMNDPT